MLMGNKESAHPLIVGIICLLYWQLALLLCSTRSKESHIATQVRLEPSPQPTLNCDLSVKCARFQKSYHVTGQVAGWPTSHKLSCSLNRINEKWSFVHEEQKVDLSKTQGKFTFPKVTPGRFVLQIMTESQVLDQRYIRVENQDIVLPPFQIPKLGIIQGQFFNDRNKRLDFEDVLGEIIHEHGAFGRPHYFSLDNNGRFRVINLRPGHAIVQLKLSRHTVYSRRIHITGNLTSTVTFFKPGGALDRSIDFQIGDGSEHAEGQTLGNTDRLRPFLNTNLVLCILEHNHSSSNSQMNASLSEPEKLHLKMSLQTTTNFLLTKAQRVTERLELLLILQIKNRFR